MEKIEWEPLGDCTCPRCDAYYDDPDAFWETARQEEVLKLPSHADN